MAQLPNEPLIDYHVRFEEAVNLMTEVAVAPSAEEQFVRYMDTVQQAVVLHLELHIKPTPLVEAQAAALEFTDVQEHMRHSQARSPDRMRHGTRTTR